MTEEECSRNCKTENELQIKDLEELDSEVD